MSGAEYLLFILMLSIFLGFELINKVPATLHTPLDVRCQRHFGDYRSGCCGTGGHRQRKHGHVAWVSVP